MSKRNLQGKALMLLVFSVLVLTAGCTAGANLPETLKTLQYIPDEVLVKFEEGVSEEEINSIARKFSLTLAEIIKGTNIYRFKLPEELTVNEAVNKLKKTKGVKNAQPNYVYRMH